jgi:SAM-dependent methyltransferase
VKLIRSSILYTKKPLTLLQFPKTDHILRNNKNNTPSGILENSGSSSKDIIGAACIDFFNTSDDSLKIEVWSDIAETDYIPVHHLFRSFTDMPVLEQTALQRCCGRILDIGAGAGSHTLWLQNQGHDVWALEISPGACRVMQKRGVKNILQQNLFDLQGNQKYNTILMLMNGIGVVGNVGRLKTFFDIARQILAPDGQILVDSSDLRYLFLDDDGSILIHLNGKYYGEVEYRMNYAGEKGRRFPWLFIDDQLLAYYAEQNGFHMERLEEGNHYDYLARIVSK